MVGRIAVGIRWSRGFRSDGVEIEGMSQLKEIFTCLVLFVGPRSMQIAESCRCEVVDFWDRGVSCVALRPVQLTELVRLLWLAA